MLRKIIGKDKWTLFRNVVCAYRQPDNPIPIQWHTVRVQESGTVIMKVKDGKYEPSKAEDMK